MARASAAVDDDHGRDRYAAEARRVLATLEDKEDRELIASQLASIPGLAPP
jgi:DNA primase